MKQNLRSPLLGADTQRTAEISAVDPLSRKSLAKQAAWESFSYDPWYSAVYEAFLQAKRDWDFQKVTILRWTLNFIIGTSVALVAVFITYASQALATLKFKALYALIDFEQSGRLAVGLAPLVFVAISVGYAAIASIPVSFVEPTAAGSGIPEIKTILNGVVLPRVLRLKTLMCKIFSVIFAVASGLPVGKEGPMVHSGASIGAGITQGKSRTFGIDTRWSVHEAFRNDREKRDFISCGAAAGVAAAFGAPVGGLLFAVEEGTTHWFRALVWRIFFCTMVSSFMLDFFNSGIEGNQWGNLGNPGMFSFGGFAAGTTIWSIQELPLYVLIGAYGGLQGGLFNFCNKHISRWRFKNVPVTRAWRRFFEVVVVTLLATLLTYALSYVYASCEPRPPPDSKAPYIDDLVSFYCPDSEYNELASLFMVPSENAIKQLFHSTSTFSIGHLAVFYFAYSGLSCVTYGISVASGLFIPSLLSGSALGRFIGELLKLGGYNVDAGTFALIGAAAVLGGTTRMTVSLAVILLETTGNYQLGLPLMLTLITARFVGNFLGEGIYDLHISLRGWPFLPEHLPKSLTNRLRVRDVMTKGPRTLEEIVRVGEVVDLLQMTSHNAFPVVYSAAVTGSYPRIGSLAGLIMRKHLTVLLARRAFHAELPTMPFVVDVADPQQPGPTALAAFSIALEGASPAGRQRPPLHPGPLSPTASSLGSPPSPRLGARRTGASFLVREPSRLDVGAPMSSPKVGPTWRTGASFLVREPSQSDMRPRASTVNRVDQGPVLLRLPAADGGLLQGVLHENGGALPRGSFAAVATLPTGLGRSVNNHHICAADLSAVGSVAETAVEAIQGKEVESREERVFEANEGDGVDLLEMLYTDEPLVKYTDVEQTYPHYPDFSSMRFSPAERAMFVDLRPYLSPTPSTIHVHTPVSAAFNAFKALALRHLVVVNDCHDCVGIITRHDLLKSRLVELGSSMNRTFVAVSGVAAENVTDAAAPDVFASGQRSAGQSTDALH